MMRKLMAGASVLAASLMMGAGAVCAQEADLTTIPAVPDDYAPSITSWGEPDFRGKWPIDHLNFSAFQRSVEQGDRYYLTDEEFAQRQQMLSAMKEGYAREDENDTMGMGHWVEPGDANRRTSFLISPKNGRLPEKTEEGLRRSALMRSSYRAGQSFDWVDDFDSWDRCITRGLPASMFPKNYNNGIRIFQSPGQVAIQLEMVHEVRIIPTDGRPGISDKIGQFLGESRGHWEDGNTLVIETTNFRPGPSATNVGTWGSPTENDTPVSRSAQMVERITMTGADKMIYEVTWYDPVIFASPWTARVDWQRDDEYEFYEYACHEGNVQVRNYITASRAERAEKGE